MTARVSVDGLARALRLLEADLGSASEQERAAGVRELAACVIDAAADPRAFYRDLAERFPIREYIDEGELGPAGGAPRPAAPAPRAPSGVDLKEFTDALGVPVEAIDEHRLIQLAATWMQFTLAVDAAVRTIWRELAKHAQSHDGAKAPAPVAIRTVSAAFLSGQGDTGPDEVRRQLDLLRRLISGMLMGLADAAKQHAQGHVRIFSPDAIRSSLPGKRNATREAAYWNQYETLVESHHAADVQAVFGEIQRRLAEYVIETLNASAGSTARG
ncbi:MAG: hypothetical protein ACF8QF_07895 [Phycisphaerales bacterium]